MLQLISLSTYIHPVRRIVNSRCIIIAQLHYTRHYTHQVFKHKTVVNEQVCPDERQQLPCPPGVLQFELFYASRCHYDVIIGAHGYLPDYPPSMPELEESYIMLL